MIKMLRFHFIPSLYYNIYYLIIFTLQCQSQLKSLYAEGNEGCYMEFSAYNLLCVILHSNNNRDLVASMARCAAYFVDLLNALILCIVIIVWFLCEICILCHAYDVILN